MEPAGTANSAENLSARPPGSPQNDSVGNPPTDFGVTQMPGDGDFITKYARYADILEAPAEAHEWVATSIEATVLNRSGIVLQHGGLEHPMDMWVLLLSDSGMGRNTLISLAGPVLSQSGLDDILYEATWGSGQAFYQRVAEQQVGLFVWPELSQVLKTLEDRKFGGVKEWLTDRFDNQKVPHAISYRTTGKKSDTPPIVFSEAPRLSILGSSSVEWFVTNLTEGDTLGGFVPRWIPIKVGASRSIPKPRQAQKSLIPEIANHLREAGRLSGKATLSPIADELYSDWYNETRKSFQEQSNRATAMPFFNRLRTSTLKLSVLYEVSQRLGLEVSEKAITRAIVTANQIAKTIFAILPSTMGREGAEITKLERAIFEAGIDGIRFNDVTRAFQHVRSQEREARLATLIQAGTVFPYFRATSGRHAKVLVHANFHRKYEESHPLDRRGGGA